MKIAIEATGCDKGFGEVLKGARRAVRENKDLELILVAGEDKVPKEYTLPREDWLSRTLLQYKLGKMFLEKIKYTLPKINSLPKRISVEIAKYTWDSEQRDQREESSIYKAVEMHKNGLVDAVIAPGDTRGTAHASERLGLLPGILSAAIPTHWPRNNVLIDSGVNISTTPEQMYQYAIMGKVYSQGYLGIKRPLIGLLTNGTERSKGNRFIRESRRLIEKLADPSKAGYNISSEYFEGNFIKDLDGGNVAITDGHTGNIFLKGVEQSLKTVSKCILKEVKKEFFVLKGFAYLGMFLPLKRIMKQLSYENYAAGPLLGINGNIMICHGRSDARTIANAVRITKKYLQCSINSKLVEEISKYGKL